MKIVMKDKIESVEVRKGKKKKRRWVVHRLRKRPEQIARTKQYKKLHQKAERYRKS